MTLLQEWPELLVDRLPNSPAAELMLLGNSPLQIDSQPHVVGRRMSEVCALFGRRLKAGSDFAAFIPASDVIDVMSVAVYLYWVRIATLLGVSAPGRWATRTLLQARQDIWLLTNVPRMRDLLTDRVTMGGHAITEKIACGWRASRGSEIPVVRSGDPKLPMLGVFGSDAVMQGSLVTVTEHHPAPFAVVIDTLGLNEGRELDLLIKRLRVSSKDAPILMLGNIGDTASMMVARDAKLPTWLLRAGDVARLDALETEQRSTLGSIIRLRPGGADQASQRLANRLNVELGVLIAPSANRLFMPLLHALQILERKAKDHAELLGNARGFTRAVLSLSVPWKIHAEAIANGKRVGRFSTPSLQERLTTLRQSPTDTGEINQALNQMVTIAKLIVEVLSSPECVTSKQAALLGAAQTAQSNEQPLHIICANQAAQRAVQMYLAENGIGMVKGCVKVDTRAQLRRAVAAGTFDGGELLVPDALGFSDGLYFSGITSRIRLLTYALERESVERQLRFISYNTQCTSATHDKRNAVVSVRSIPLDKDLESAAARWEFKLTELDLPGVWPGQVEAVESFTYENSDWLQQTLAGIEEEPDDTATESSEARTSGSVGPHVLFTLDTEQRSFSMSPRATVILLPAKSENYEAGKSQKHEARSIPASEICIGSWLLIAQRIHNGDFLDRILERCSLSGELIVAQQLRCVWQDALAQLYDLSEGSGSNALARLIAHGVLVTTSQTVLHWLRGDTVGPRDLESIIAVGRETQRVELTDNPQLIFDALGQMRRLFTAIITKVYEYAKTGASLGPDDVIDPVLRLRRSDLQNFVVTGYVTAVETVARAA